MHFLKHYTKRYIDDIIYMADPWCPGEGESFQEPSRDGRLAAGTDRGYPKTLIRDISTGELILLQCCWNGRVQMSHSLI